MYKSKHEIFEWHNLNVRMAREEEEKKTVKESSLARRLKHVSFLSKFLNNNIYIMKMLVTFHSNGSCNRSWVPQRTIDLLTANAITYFI